MTATNPEHIAELEQELVQTRMQYDEALQRHDALLEKTEEARDYASQLGIMSAALAVACVAAESAGSFVDTTIQNAVSIHQETEDAIRDVAQFFSEVGASGKVVFGFLGVVGLSVAGGLQGVLKCSAWMDKRDQKADDYRRHWNAEQKKIINSVFTQTT